MFVHLGEISGERQKQQEQQISCLSGGGGKGAEEVNTNRMEGSGESDIIFPQRAPSCEDIVELREGWQRLTLSVCKGSNEAGEQGGLGEFNPICQCGNSRMKGGSRSC